MGDELFKVLWEMFYPEYSGKTRNIISRITGEKSTKFAKSAGVDPGTLSRALNRKGTLSEADIVKIRDHVRKYDGSRALEWCDSLEQARASDQRPIEWDRMRQQSGAYLREQVGYDKSLCFWEGKPDDAMRQVKLDIDLVLSLKQQGLLTERESAYYMTYFRYVHAHAAMLALPADELPAVSEPDIVWLKQRRAILKAGDQLAYDLSGELLVARIKKISYRDRQQIGQAAQLLDDCIKSGDIETATALAECYGERVVIFALPGGDRNKFDKAITQALDAIDAKGLTPLAQGIIHARLVTGFVLMQRMSEAKQSLNRVELLKEELRRYAPAWLARLHANFMFHARDDDCETKTVIEAARELEEYSSQFPRSRQYLVHELQNHPSEDVKAYGATIV